MEMMRFKIKNVDGAKVYEGVNSSQPVSIFQNKDGEWDGVFSHLGQDVFPRTFGTFVEAVEYATLEVGLER